MTHQERVADAAEALEFCEGLFSALSDHLSDVGYVNAVTERLKSLGLAPTFPETRFCKGCVLPVVDEFATGFLERRYGATTQEVRASLRCEGFQTLDQYFIRSERMSGYCGSPWNRDRTAESKSGSGLMSGANPDFTVRYGSPCGAALRMVGEVKFLPRRLTSLAAVAQLRSEIRHYLSITGSPRAPDWHHDFGFGLMYCGMGAKNRRAELLRDDWASSKLMIAYFHA